MSHTSSSFSSFTNISCFIPRKRRGDTTHVGWGAGGMPCLWQSWVPWTLKAWPKTSFCVQTFATASVFCLLPSHSAPLSWRSVSSPLSMLKGLPLPSLPFPHWRNPTAVSGDSFLVTDFHRKDAELGKGREKQRAPEWGWWEAGPEVTAYTWGAERLLPRCFCS